MRGAIILFSIQLLNHWLYLDRKEKHVMSFIPLKFVDQLYSIWPLAIVTEPKSEI